MKCPLRSTSVVKIDERLSPVMGDCLQEECAWWEDDLRICAIKEIALELRYAQQRLGDINDKMRRGV